MNINVHFPTSGTSSLPPLFPQQQGPQTSHHDNTKLIEEVSQTQPKVRPSQNHQITAEIEEEGGREEVESKLERTPEYTLDVCQKAEKTVVCVTVQLTGVSSVEDVELEVSMVCGYMYILPTIARPTQLVF